MTRLDEIEREARDWRETNMAQGASTSLEDDILALVAAARAADRWRNARIALDAVLLSGNYNDSDIVPLEAEQELARREYESARTPLLEQVKP